MSVNRDPSALKEGSKIFAIPPPSNAIFPLTSESKIGINQFEGPEVTDGPQIKRLGAEAVRAERKGRRWSIRGGVRETRYQFSLRGKTVAAPLIDRKILICLTRAYTRAEFRAEAKKKTKGSGGCHAVVQEERQRELAGRARKGKKIYRLVAGMPEARRIPLNWNALPGLSDLAGFRRKWAFKCAREPFTTVDISAARSWRAFGHRGSPRVRFLHTIVPLSHSNRGYEVTVFLENRAFVLYLCGGSNL